MRDRGRRRQLRAELTKYAAFDPKTVDGFAEIFPEDKHMIVQLLQNKGFVVGMTGDGANVPPLSFPPISSGLSDFGF
jgi:hypothetical protein